MSEIKKTKIRHPRLGLKSIFAFVLFVVIFIFYALVSLNIVKITLAENLYNALLYSLLGLAALMLGISVYYILKWRNYSTKIRFDYNTFALVKDIRSEKIFLTEVNKYLKRPDSQGALICFSPIKFKKIVFSRYGYERGAVVFELIFQAISELGSKFKHAIYGYDFNENFLLFFPHKNDLEIELKIEDLKDIITRRLNKEDVDVKFSTNFGVSYNIDENKERISAATMLQRALIAADFGRLESDLGGISIYEERMFEKNKRNVQLAREVEKGIESSQFEVYYQPKYDLKLKRFSGAEALLRWNHPELGLLSPAAFIIFAEQSDLIIKMDRYVVEKVCESIAKWRDNGERLLPISVNLSKRSIFMGDILGHIQKTTERLDINPMLLEIEIIESPALQDILLLLSIVKKFKAMRIKVAIDDFGTGYSSLSYIKKIPFDIVKIDKAFLDDLDIDHKSRAIVKNIIDLAHILDTYVIIEGVQDEKQLAMLEKMGADGIQGFYYSRPLRNDAYLAFLADNPFEKGRKKK